jgi:hypothetical protein
LGKAVIEQEGKVLKEVNLLAKTDVAKAGLLKRIWYFVVLFFIQLFSWL